MAKHKPIQRKIIYHYLEWTAITSSTLAEVIKILLI